MLVRPPQPLTDGVVGLRPWRVEDAPAVAAACVDPEIAQWTTVPSPYTLADAQSFVEATEQGWIEGRVASFAVELHGQVAGAIDVKLAPGEEPTSAEIGYWVVPETRRRGVAARALGLVTAWSFEELGLQVVLLEILVGNHASVAVAEAAGFRWAGRVEAAGTPASRVADLYSRLASGAPV